MNAAHAAAGFLLLASTFTSSSAAVQVPHGTVPLEAADCSRTWASFGDRQVVHAVRHATAPVGAGTLDVRPGANGGVRIEPAAGDQYSITACIAAGADSLAEAQRAVEAVTLSVDGGRVRLADPGMARSLSVQLIVEAPRGARIDVETANGPISVQGAEATITARASNGPISIKESSGAVRAVAVNGPITISGSRGNFDVETQNGPISVRLAGTRWDGELQARAGNGPLSLVVSDDYTSGVEISSSGGAPWSCRLAACAGAGRDQGQRSRTLRLGSDPVVVKLSTINGPVTLEPSR